MAGPRHPVQGVQVLLQQAQVTPCRGHQRGAQPALDMRGLQGTDRRGHSKAANDNIRLCRLELSSPGGRAEMKNLCLQLYKDGPSPGGKPNALLYKCFFRLPDNGIFMFGPEPCLTQEKVNK